MDPSPDRDGRVLVEIRSVGTLRTVRGTKKRTEQVLNVRQLRVDPKRLRIRSAGWGV